MKVTPFVVFLNHCLQSQAQYGFRRASDTLLMVRPAQKGGKHSPSLTPHRERATLLVPDATMQAASVAKAIGKGE